MQERRQWKGAGRGFAGGLALAAGLLVGLPSTGHSATAAHDPWKLKEVRVDGLEVSSAFGKCDACHTLDNTEGESGTSYLSSTARTLPWIKFYRGGGAFLPADTLACTFCHTMSLGNTYMEDALQEFDTPTIKHPMGRRVDGVTNTNNEWLSKIDSAPAADELQCASCHATTLLTYPYHQGRTTDPAPWTGSWDTAVNPAALLNVTVAGDGGKRFCVETCHGNAVAGGNAPTRPLMGHYAYGSFNGTTLRDATGEALQVAGSTCVTCHDSHTSQKPGLLQDGLKRGAADAGRSAIDENNCVAVCHAAGAFGTHGHGGKVGINTATCAPCHVSSIRHRDQTDDASRRRLSYADPLRSNLARNLAADGLDNDMNGSKDAADPGETAFAYSKTSNCKSCHINYASHGSATRAAACLDCHDMHGDDAAVNDNAAMIRSTLFGENTTFTAADRAGRTFYKGGADPAGVCDNDACHSNVSGPLATAHRAGAAALAQPCSDCHAISHTAAPNTDESFKVACTGCHGPGGTGPTVVWPAGNAAGRRTSYGSHLGSTSAEEGNTFLGGLGAAWTGQCNKCHDGHSGTIKVPAPPASWTDPSGRLTGTNMRTRLGLTYANEANVALHLGGTARGGASEAEFCWGCHDANGVSEWGFNTKTTPAGFPVVTFTTPDGNQESENHGWIYTTAGHATRTSDWTQGYWMSQYDAVLARRVASVHSANFDPAGQSSSVATNVNASGVVNRTSPTLEARGYLRCSNCHDVHDTFGPSGKPYLRGRSTGNPYPPELPPRNGYSYTTYINTLTGTRTPRATSAARDKGGYFIDQNSGWPTNNGAMDTLAETAELCTLCHGADVDGMDFYTGRKLWRAPMVNGHSNAALGGTGANKVDLFSAIRGDSYSRGMGMQNGQPTTPWVCGGDGLSCDYAYPQVSSCCVCEWDCGNIQYSGWYGSDFANWYGTGTIGSASGVAGDRAHKFTCSKCHTPHASGLPALLTQNCIDPALGTFTVNGASGVNLIASNCHRKTSTVDGWHVLAPGQ